MYIVCSSGGMFHDCGVHDFDFVCWILGEYPTTVFTQAHAQNEHIAAMDDVDTVVIVMKFPSGIIGIVELSRHSTYGYDQRIEVSSPANIEHVHYWELLSRMINI